MTTPHAPTKYLGPDQYLGVIVVRDRNPTTADYRQPETGKNYPIGCIWQVGKSPTTGTQGNIWILTKIVSNLGYWVLIASGIGPSGSVLTLSDTANTLVTPTVAGNIQIQGTAGIAVTADVANNRLILALSGGSTAVDTFTTNVSGPVVPTSLGTVLVNASSSTFTDGAVANTLKTEVQATNHALKVGRGTNVAMADLTVGATHSILMGNTAADPDFTTTGTPYVAGISFDTGSNVLNRYNNITTFTPSIAGSTGTGSATYQSQYGAYTRIGNLVFIQINLVWTGHTGTGNMIVAGFPFIFAAAASFYPMATLVQNIVLPAGAIGVVTDGVNATTTAEVACSIDNAAIAQVQMDAAGSVFLTGCYLTDP